LFIPEHRDRADVALSAGESPDREFEVRREFEMARSMGVLKAATIAACAGVPSHIAKVT
jgi:hypothetical protein